MMRRTTERHDGDDNPGGCTGIRCLDRSGRRGRGASSAREARLAARVETPPPALRGAGSIPRGVRPSRGADGVRSALGHLRAHHRRGGARVGAASRDPHSGDFPRHNAGPRRGGGRERGPTEERPESPSRASKSGRLHRTPARGRDGERPGRTSLPAGGGDGARLRNGAERDDDPVGTSQPSSSSGRRAARCLLRDPRSRASFKFKGGLSSIGRSSRRCCACARRRRSRSGFDESRKAWRRQRRPSESTDERARR